MHFQLYLDDPEDSDIDDYIEFVKGDGAWCGYTEIYALTQIFEVNFLIVLKSGGVIPYNNFQNQDVRYLFLAYHEDEGVPEHYNSIRLVEDYCGNRSEVRLPSRIDPNLFIGKVKNDDRDTIDGGSGGNNGKGSANTRQSKKVSKLEKKGLKKEALSKLTGKGSGDSKNGSDKTEVVNVEWGGCSNVSSGKDKQQLPFIA